MIQHVPTVEVILHGSSPFRFELFSSTSLGLSFQLEVQR